MNIHPNVLLIGRLVKTFKELLVSIIAEGYEVVLCTDNTASAVQNGAA